MRSARIAAAVSFSLAVLLTIPHATLAQRAPAGGMGGLFGAPMGGRAGAFGVYRGWPGAFGFHRGFVSNGLDAGFRRRVGAGLDMPRLGPMGFGFPSRGFVGFPGDRFGFFGSPFFGFPRRQSGFFFDGFFDGFGFAVFPFVDGFGFFDGFPVIDGFPFFPGFPDRPFGFFGFPRRRFGFFPFPGQGFGFFGPGGFPLGSPFGFGPSFVGWTGGGASSEAGGPQPADTLAFGHAQRASEPQPVLGRQLAVPGTGSAAGDSLVVERVTVMDVVPAAALRLTWRNAGLPAQQVALFLADTAQAVLVAQTVRAPPFTALLEPPPGTAFAGVTVAWPDGTTSTRLVPYRFLRR